VRKRIGLETELRRAVESGLDDAAREDAPFIVYYQPIAALGSGEIKSYEALVRWQHPERGLVPPNEFIPVAEETGLIVPLGRWILREACRQTAQWQQIAALRGEQPVGVSVNISARQLAQPEFPFDVAAALAMSDLPASSLTLEVTESMLVDDSEATLNRLTALKALGIRIAIDDFGTGYSSLGYLERFAVDLLKIDKSFIDQVGTLHTESPLARAIVGLGRELGMHVVAEGIENEAQWLRLRDLGCDLGQGYFLAKPRPASELFQTLRPEFAA
jgi:EAL domain-containing protein (putative c-di-GMP-specific phosphodiesterase class I)